jgi:hypothetical protein
MVPPITPAISQPPALELQDRSYLEVFGLIMEVLFQ